MWVVSVGISTVMLHFKDMRMMRSEVIEERADVSCNWYLLRVLSIKLIGTIYVWASGINFYRNSEICRRGHDLSAR